MSEINDAYEQCKNIHTSGTDAFWNCVQAKICRNLPETPCRLLIAGLRWVNPIPRELRPGDFFSSRGLPVAVAASLHQLHTDLIQPNAVIQTSDILNVVRVMQAAGRHRRAIQGLEIISQVEALGNTPQFNLLSEAQALKAVSLDAIGSQRAAVDSRALAMLLAKAAIR